MATDGILTIATSTEPAHQRLFHDMLMRYTHCVLAIVAFYDGPWTVHPLDFFLNGILFGLLEYFVHRCAHIKKDPGHMLHHKNPHDTRFYLVSNVAFTKTMAAFLVVYMLGLVKGTVLAWLVVWYMLYELVHAELHVGEGAHTKVAQEWHDIHHAMPAFNHGVTTTGWDSLFGTAAATPLFYGFDFIPNYGFLLSYFLDS